MEKEMKIIAPEGSVVERVKIIDSNVAVVTFKKKERKLPKSWEEFCETYPIPFAFAKTKTDFDPFQAYRVPYHNRLVDAMHEFTNDHATAEAVLALCKLILLRDCYNGDWVPDWDGPEPKYFIEFSEEKIITDAYYTIQSSPLFFKTEELRDEFLRNFRDLIEKLKPLYGIIK